MTTVALSALLGVGAKTVPRKYRRKPVVVSYEEHLSKDMRM